MGDGRGERREVVREGMKERNRKKELATEGKKEE